MITNIASNSKTEYSCPDRPSLLEPPLKKSWHLLLSNLRGRGCMWLLSPEASDLPSGVWQA